MVRFNSCVSSFEVQRTEGAFNAPWWYSPATRGLLGGTGPIDADVDVAPAEPDRTASDSDIRAVLSALATLGQRQESTASRTCEVVDNLVNEISLVRTARIEDKAAVSGLAYRLVALEKRVRGLPSSQALSRVGDKARESVGEVKRELFALRAFVEAASDQLHSPASSSTPAEAATLEPSAAPHDAPDVANDTRFEAFAAKCGQGRVFIKVLEIFAAGGSRPQFVYTHCVARAGACRG